MYVGSNSAIIMAYDNFGGLTDDQNIWKYYSYNPGAWMTSAPNDTSVQCCQTVIVMCGSCHIGNVLIGVEYRNCCQTLDVYLLFAF